MKDSFEKFVNLCRKSLKLDPWANEAGLSGYCTELKGEVDEVSQAIEKKDILNLREELGDVLLDWVHLCLHAEKNGYFEMKEIIGEIETKLNERKPYLKENYTPSKEERIKMWFDAKKQQQIKQMQLNEKLGFTN